MDKFVQHLNLSMVRVVNIFIQFNISFSRRHLLSRDWRIQEVNNIFQTKTNETVSEKTEVIGRRKVVKSFRYPYFRQQTSQRSEATSTLETVLTNILDQRIQAFLSDPNARQLQFEDGLSPFGRRYVHEVCD